MKCGFVDFSLVISAPSWSRNCEPSVMVLPFFLLLGTALEDDVFTSDAGAAGIRDAKNFFEEQERRVRWSSDRSLRFVDRKPSGV